jgi:sec-independent protein translocase protein TatA
MSFTGNFHPLLVHFPIALVLPAAAAELVVIWRRIPMGEGLLQPMHLLVIFGIALLVFGPKKLPELGKGLGEAIRGFKSSLIEGEQPGTALDSATKK